MNFTDMTLTSRPTGAAGQSRHSLIARALLEQVASGRYRVGELLPTEGEVCRQFGVSRTTIRKAMRWLRDRGMVAARPGVGTTMLAMQPSARYVHAIESTSDVFFQYARNSCNPGVLSVEEHEVDDEDTELLRCAPGQRWLRIELTRTFHGDKTPILYSRVHVPHAYAGIAPLEPTRSAPIYTLLESEYAEQVSGVEQEFKAVRIEARTARSLHLRRDGPDLCAVRHYFGSGDRLLLGTESFYRTDRDSYRIHLSFNPQLGKRGQSGKHCDRSRQHHLSKEARRGSRPHSS